MKPSKKVIWGVAVIGITLVIISIVTSVIMSDMKYAYYTGETSFYYWGNPEYHRLSRISTRTLNTGMPILFFLVPGLLAWRNWREIKEFANG